MYTVFFTQSGKIYTWQNFFTQAPPVVSVTNMRYDLWVCKFEIWYQTPMLNIEAEIEKRVFETAYWICLNQINLSWPYFPFFVKQRPKIHFFYMSHKCRVGENDVEFRKKIWRLPFSWSVFRWLNSPLFYIQCFLVLRENKLWESK